MKFIGVSLKRGESGIFVERIANPLYFAGESVISEPVR